MASRQRMKFIETGAAHRPEGVTFGTTMAVCHMCGKETIAERAEQLGWSKNYPRVGLGIRELIWTCTGCVERDG